MIATGGTVGPAEWIIDGTHVVFIIFRFFPAENFEGFYGPFSIAFVSSGMTHFYPSANQESSLSQIDRRG